MLLITMAVAALVGGAWTIIPALLRGRYGVNEIITTLMMSFIGIGVANVLVKGPFRTEILGVARTDVIPFDQRLPLLFGTRIHLGFVLGRRRPARRARADDAGRRSGCGCGSSARARARRCTRGSTRCG